jgi:hypothetical protein
MSRRFTLGGISAGADIAEKIQVGVESGIPATVRGKHISI